MIRSMTAFAANESEIDGVLYGWEVRTVNHRYLEIMLRIPENLRTLEPAFRALIGQQLKRGKVDCYLNCRSSTAMHNAVRIHRQNLLALFEIMRQIESEIHDTVPCSALEILKWPGILADQAIDPQALEKPLVEILRTTLSRTIECREREGKQLAMILSDRCERLNEQIQLVRSRLPEVIQKLRMRLHSRLVEATPEIDPLRFEQEIAFMLQKMDIDEEIERLSAHLSEVARVIEKEDIAGRRLDFLMQEMNRETNTLGSKSLDQQVSLACVEMKVLIEQMREQVQNIE